MSKGAAVREQSLLLADDWQKRADDAEESRRSGNAANR